MVVAFLLGDIDGAAVEVHGETAYGEAVHGSGVAVNGVRGEVLEFQGAQVLLI
ncbi:MAG: hypothetical protein GKR94_04590 [Gammaproteobacteria bacterium]|nr:hypothetical protein [Gammaproteobacteria bacterium]